MKNEPALIIGVLAAVVVAVLQAATAVGWTWSYQHVFMVISPIVAGFLTRQFVFSPATVERLTGRPTPG